MKSNNIARLIGEETKEAKAKLAESGKFRREVIGRMNAIIKFNPLTGDVIKDIAAKCIRDTAAKSHLLYITEIDTPIMQEFINTTAGEVADPAECKMIADLGVTMLAAGIGNIHGKYPANWQGLNFEALAKISEQVGDMPLVLHGGTGIPEEMIKKAISLGVSKINVNTECQLSFAAATRKYIEEGKDLQGKGFDPRKLLAPGTEAIKATVREKIALFGSANKA